MADHIVVTRYCPVCKRTVKQEMRTKDKGAIAVFICKKCGRKS